MVSSHVDPPRGPGRNHLADKSGIGRITYIHHFQTFGAGGHVGEVPHQPDIPQFIGRGDGQATQPAQDHVVAVQQEPIGRRLVTGIAAHAGLHQEGPNVGHRQLVPAQLSRSTQQHKLHRQARGCCGPKPRTLTQQIHAVPRGTQQDGLGEMLRHAHRARGKPQPNRQYTSNRSMEVCVVHGYESLNGHHSNPALGRCLGESHPGALAATRRTVTALGGAERNPG